MGIHEAVFLLKKGNFGSCVAGGLPVHHNRYKNFNHLSELHVPRSDGLDEGSQGIFFQPEYNNLFHSYH